MKIPLKDIKPAPYLVRKTWDEEEMGELVESVKERGVIVPIKVRPRGKGYEIVYGHRRVEASKRAGLSEIEAIVADISDGEALLQAFIENEQREDMQPMDIALSLKEMMTKNGWTMADVERAGVMRRWKARHYLRLLEEPEEIQRLVVRSDGPRSQGSPDGTMSMRALEAIQQARLDTEDRIAVVQKVVNEGLPFRQAEKVAASIAAAPSEEAKKRLLEWQYSPVIHNPEFVRGRAQEYGAYDPIYRDRTPAQADQWRETPEAKAVVQGVIDAAKRWQELANNVRQMADIGKLSPESCQFIAFRTRQQAQAMMTWANELEARKDHAN